MMFASAVNKLQLKYNRMRQAQITNDLVDVRTCLLPLAQLSECIGLHAAPPTDCHRYAIYVLRLPKNVETDALLFGVQVPTLSVKLSDEKGLGTSDASLLCSPLKASRGKSMQRVVSDEKAS